MQWEYTMYRPGGSGMQKAMILMDIISIGQITGGYIIHKIACMCTGYSLRPGLL
jgi:hypothetical protein